MKHFIFIFLLLIVPKFNNIIRTTESLINLASSASNRDCNSEGKMKRNLLPKEILSHSTAKFRNDLTFDSCCSSAVVEDGQLSKHLAWSHGAQLHSFFCHFNLPICVKRNKKNKTKGYLKGENFLQTKKTLWKRACNLRKAVKALHI